MSTENEETTNNRDPFLQRAIEYWLDSANELGYQPLFCEWLTTMGYTMKYSIRNTNFEQGKDVVAVAPDEIPHAYQLKGGNINLNRWRSEVRPEIEALIDCPIEHPEIDKEKGHVSYLVTNGLLDDSVRVEIVRLNEKKWKDSPLHVWERGDLLSGFQTIAEGILPKDAITYKKLIDLIFAEGNGMPEISKVYSFLSEILDIDNPALAKEQRRRNIAAATLYATMIAGEYRKWQNHASVVQIMILLLSLVFYIVDKYNLEDKYWISSYKIIWGDIIHTSKLLETEINQDGFDSSATDPLANELMPFRRHTAISIIYPLKLSQFIDDNDEWRSMLDPNIGAKYKETILLWGETTFISFMTLAFIFRSLKEGEGTALRFLETSIAEIITHNGRKSKVPIGLPSTYYGIDFIIKLQLEMLEKPFEEKFKLKSHLLKPFIEILARANDREFLSESWREISFMRMEQFIPEKPEDYYLWQAEKGENITYLPKGEKSWKELVEEANAFTGNSLPKTLKRFPNFIPFFIALFPHRATSDLIGFLDQASKK